MLRWFCAAVTAAVVSGFAFLLVTGRYISDGPTIAKLGGGHGVHLGDVFVVSGWAAAVVMLAGLAWEPGRVAEREAAILADSGGGRCR